MKTKIMKITSLVLCIALSILSVFCMVACTDNVTNSGERDTEQLGMELEFIETSPHIKLSSEPKNAPTIENSAVLLTATVYPLDAPNKQVDWSVEWGEGSTLSANPVTNYVTVTPVSGAENSANVKCLQGFGSNLIIITVTTRSGGYKAYCQVSFVGVPTDLTIDTSSVQVQTVSSWDKNMCSIGCGQTYTFPIKLSNAYNSIGSQYGDYSFNIEAHGGITYTKQVLDSEGTLLSTLTESADLVVSDTRTSNGEMYAHIPCQSTLWVLMTVSVVGNNLVIEGGAMPNAYEFHVGSRTGQAIATFSNYFDNKIPYVTVTVTDNTSGLSTSIDLVNVASTASVSLNRSTIVF